MMTSRLLFILLSIMLINSCGAQQQEPLSDNPAKREIEQFLDDWNDAMVVADTVKLSAMMDDNIVLRHMSGMTQTKSEWLKEVASGSMKYHKIVKRDVMIELNDDRSANVAFTSAITATIWGSYGTWTLHGKMLLEKRNGQWVRVE